MRLRHLRIGLCNRDQPVQRSNLVRCARQRSIEIHESTSDILRLGFQQHDHMRTRLFQFSAAQQQGDQHLLRQRRGRLQLLPQFERFHRLVVLVRFEGELRRTPCHTRIARGLGEVEISLRRQLRPAALCRDVTQQEFVQQAISQRHTGQIKLGWLDDLFQMRLVCPGVCTGNLNRCGDRCLLRGVRAGSQQRK